MIFFMCSFLSDCCSYPVRKTHQSILTIFFIRLTIDLVMRTDVVKVDLTIGDLKRDDDTV